MGPYRGPATVARRLCDEELRALLVGPRSQPRCLGSRSRRHFGHRGPARAGHRLFLRPRLRAAARGSTGTCPGGGEVPDGEHESLSRRDHVHDPRPLPDHRRSTECADVAVRPAQLRPLEQSYGYLRSGEHDPRESTGGHLSGDAAGRWTRTEIPCSSTRRAYPLRFRSGTGGSSTGTTPREPGRCALIKTSRGEQRGDRDPRAGPRRRSLPPRPSSTANWVGLSSCTGRGRLTSSLARSQRLRLIPRAVMDTA